MKSLQTRTSRRIFSVLCALALTSLAGQGMADNYPTKAIRVISPSPPGGGTDAMSRLVASRLTETAKWQVFVENVPGAGNNIGLRAGARAAPDGYTLVMGETSNLAVNPYLYKSLDFSAVDDLVPVALMGSGPLVLVVRTESRFDSLASVIQAGKKSDLFYASSGSGTVGHLVAESLRDATGVKLQHIPYKGAGPAMNDLLGGQVDLYFASLTAALPHIAAGKLRPLAVSSEKRHGALPKVSSQRCQVSHSRWRVRCASPASMRVTWARSSSCAMRCSLSSQRLATGVSCSPNRRIAPGAMACGTA